MTNFATNRRLLRARALGEELLLAFAAGRTGPALASILRGQPMDLDETEAGFSLRLYGFQTGRHRTATSAIIAWARLATGDPENARRRELTQAASRERAA